MEQMGILYFIRISDTGQGKKSAVYRHGNAGNEARCFIVDQIFHSADDILAGAESSHRCMGNDLLSPGTEAGLGTFQVMDAHGRYNKSRCNCMTRMLAGAK